MDLAGGRVLVTGGGSGIGRAIARAVSRAGAAVAVNDIDGTRAAETCAQIEADGGVAHSAVGDISDRAGAAAVVDAAVAALGGLSGLANNAGIVRGGPLADLDEASWRDTVALDLDAVLWCSQAARPALEASGGAIVNTSSLVALAPAPGSGAYSAAKAGVVALTQQCAVEWGPRGIRVNAIAPGLVGGTRFSPQSGDPDLQARRGAVVPLRRTATADDVAPVVVFLLSDAAGYVTAQTLVVDGGFGAALQTFVPA